MEVWNRTYSDKRYIMGFLRRQQKPVTDIRFVDDGNRSYKSRLWTSDEVIQGIAHFRIPPDTQCTHASVAFKGVITIQTNESSPGSLQPKCRIERSKFLCVGREGQIGSRHEDGSIDVPFRFHLTECSTHSSLENGLPPSLDSRNATSGQKSFRDRSDTAIYDVKYTITASLQHAQLTGIGHRDYLDSTRWSTSAAELRLARGDGRVFHRIDEEPTHQGLANGKEGALSYRSGRAGAFSACLSSRSRWERCVDEHRSTSEAESRVFEATFKITSASTREDFGSLQDESVAQRS